MGTTAATLESGSTKFVIYAGSPAECSRRCADSGLAYFTWDPHFHLMGKFRGDEGEESFSESSSESFSGWILNSVDNDDYEGSAYWQRDPFGGWDTNGDSNSGSLFQSPQPCFCKDETQAKVPGTRKVGATSGRACKSTTPYSEEELAYKAETCEAGIEADVFQYPGNQVARSVLLQAGTGDPRLCAQHCAQRRGCLLYTSPSPRDRG